MIDDWAALIFLPLMGLGFASSYLWFMFRPGFTPTPLRRLSKAWQTFADKHGGKLKLPGRELSLTEPPTLKVTLDEVDVMIQARAWREWTYGEEGLETCHQYETLIIAQADCPYRTNLVLMAEESQKADSKQTDSFLRKYDIRASNIDLAHCWMNQDFRKSAVKTTGYTYTLEEGRSYALKEDMELDAEELETAARCVVALAKRGEELNEQWQHLAQTLQGRLRTKNSVFQSDGGTAIELDRNGCRITIDTLMTGTYREFLPTRIVTRISTRLMDHQTPRFVLFSGAAPSHMPRIKGSVAFHSDLQGKYEIRSLKPKQTVRRLTPEICRLIVELDPYVISVDGTSVTVLLNGVEQTMIRLNSASRLVTLLARPGSTSPYR